MFKLTPAAAEQILRAARAQAGAGPMAALRVAAKIDEDGELVYGMGFDDERENDHVSESEGVVVLIAPRSLELLAETTLDFVELNPGEYQFIFIDTGDRSDDGEPSAGSGGGGSGCGGCGGRC
ncbi:MAG: hypothetical protein JNM82_12230 [Rhodocyclaceae bacterium]|nr:hypothetical protein [Rhodocyclaceae bacterium]